MEATKVRELINKEIADLETQTRANLDDWWRGYLTALEWVVHNMDKHE